VLRNLDAEVLVNPLELDAVRLIVDSAQPGHRNMAIDEALLHSAAAGVTSLRFYEWSAPTLSLGYFQEYGQREQHRTSLECACVRRSSGGGAILHDRELTYSFTAPAADRGSSQWGSIYDLFHHGLVRALSHWSLQACLSQASGERRGVLPPFLCFERRAQGDVLIGDRKVCGSAQRRHRGALLQHGSVILKGSPFAPEILGIADITGRHLSSGDLAEAWRAEIAASCGACWEAGELSHVERERAQKILVEQFAHSGWLNRR
jgi:lipoate-protein ligase A